jgi:hypothetical protein
MPIDENEMSPFAATVSAAVIFAYPKRPGDGDEHRAGEAIGVVAGQFPADSGIHKRLIHSDADSEQFLWTGLTLSLHKDDSESYYSNLMGEKPSVFIVCRLEDERLQPFLLTLSYDEADSYMEVDEAVSAVAMPPEIYRWCETFVLAHYVPEKKRKRKRDNWKQDARRP